jgi:hypothetical protein
MGHKNISIFDTLSQILFYDRWPPQHSRQTPETPGGVSGTKESFFPPLKINPSIWHPRTRLKKLSENS